MRLSARLLLALSALALLATGCGDEPRAVPGHAGVTERVAWSRWTRIAKSEQVLGREVVERLKQPVVKVEDEQIPAAGWFPLNDLLGETRRVWVAFPRYEPVEEHAGRALPVTLHHADRSPVRFDPETKEASPQTFAYADGKVTLVLGVDDPNPGEGYSLSYWARSADVVGSLGALIEAQVKPQLVSAGAEARMARALAPPGALAATLEVPEDARLHLGFLVPGRSFRAGEEGVREVRAGGDGVGFELAVEADGEREVVWRRFVEPQERDVYHDAVVSLTHYAGQRVRVVWSTCASEDGAAEPDASDDCAFVCRPFLDAAPAEPMPDVVLVVLDTLRADALGCYGNSRDLTPALDRFAEEGCQLTDARSSAPWTLPSHCSLFTSLLPIQHGTLTSNMRLSERFETVAEVVAHSGWRTAAFSDGGFVSASFGLERGFGRFDARGGGAEVVFDRAASWLRDTEGPAFVFVQTYDVHTPYDPDEADRERWVRPYSGTLPAEIQWSDIPPESVNAFTEEDARYVHDVYEAEVAELDRHFGAFLDQLRALPNWPNTLVIVTSDHGEAFMEHGSFQHVYTLYEELLRIPLLVRYPGRFEGGQRLDHPVRIEDIPSTILNVLGLPQPEAWIGIPVDQLPGERDLMATLSPEGGYAVYDAIGRHKWITMPDGKYPSGRVVEPGEYFDLVADPGEQHNLCDLAVQQRHEARLQELLEQYPNLRGNDDSKATLSAELREALHGLGYVR